MNNLKWQAAAVVLAVVMVGSLGACNRAGDQTRMGAEQGTEGVQQVRGEEAGNLEDLQAGQPLDYYTDEFQRMGYQVYDVNWGRDEVRYDLRRENQRYEVTLQLPERTATGDRMADAGPANQVDWSQQRVEDINVREFRSQLIGQAGRDAQGRPQAGDQQKDAETQRMISQVEALQPGKMPYEYIPMVSKFGTVTEYEMDGDMAEMELESPKGQQFSVEMQLGNDKRVSNIQVNDSFWQF